uniref:Uncharacterized protein n=1 Tax=Rhizophora mucronata TaxID=61149 RepID=A0A2P2IU95_RHIMU
MCCCTCLKQLELSLSCVRTHKCDTQSHMFSCPQFNFFHSVDQTMLVLGVSCLSYIISSAFLFLLLNVNVATANTVVLFRKATAS